MLLRYKKSSVIRQLHVFLELGGGQAMTDRQMPVAEVLFSSLLNSHAAFSVCVASVLFMSGKAVAVQIDLIRLMCSLC